MNNVMGLLRSVCGIVVLAIAAAVVVQAAPQGRAAKPPAKRTSQAFTCVAELGMGVATKRRFCDVMVATVVAPLDRLAEASRLALEFLNGDMIVKWARAEFGV